MSRRTRHSGVVARFGPRYGVRIRRRVQEVEETVRARHVCPNCQAVSVKRASSGVWTCRRCGHTFAGGAYRPIVTTSFKRELAQAPAAEVAEPPKAGEKPKAADKRAKEA